YELACGRVERDDGAAGARRRVDDPARHQRSGFEVELGPRTEVLGLEPPRDLELVEIVRVDLVERGVPGVGEIAAVGRPLPVFRAGLAGDGQRRPHEQTCQREDWQTPPTNR